MVATMRALERYHGFDRLHHVRYLKWVAGFLRGHLGHSFYWNVPVDVLLLDRLPLTAAVFLATLACACLLAIPIAMYSTTHQYSFWDYTRAIVGFVGLATPILLLIPFVCTG